MPKVKYVKKVNRCSWSNKDMKKAVKAVVSKTHSIRKAVKIHRMHLQH